MCTAAHGQQKLRIKNVHIDLFDFSEVLLMGSTFGMSSIWGPLEVFRMPKGVSSTLLRLGKCGIYPNHLKSFRQ